MFVAIFLVSLAILSERRINFDKLAKAPILGTRFFSHISESQCDPSTKMYTTSAVISEDQKEMICKKFRNPFLKKVNVKVNDVDL